MKKVDATQGSMLKSIFTFAIPMILATIAQDLFTVADKAVLGQIAGSTALASVGATGAVTSLIINGAVGISSGTTIVLARFWGQKNEEKIRSTIDTALMTGVGLGVIVAILGFFLAPLFLTMTKCPAECFDGALLYIRIYLSAAPITLFYNYGASVLRTIGDTQRPLIYILIGGAVNVVLNVILCFILPQKVAAVAIATVASKLVSGSLVLRRLCHLEEDYARVVIPKMRFDLPSFSRIFKFGVPTAISNIVLPLGNLQITTAINSYGVAAIAGNSAAISVAAVGSAFAAGFSSATSTFMGQNIGAKKRDRARTAFWCSSAMNVLITGSMGVLLYLTGRIWLGMIVGFEQAADIDYGMIRLSYVCLTLFVHAINSSMGGAIQAFGYAGIRSISNISFNLGFRVIWMQFIYPLNQTFGMVMQCFLVSWLLNMLFYAVLLSIIYPRYVKKGICKKV